MPLVSLGLVVLAGLTGFCACLCRSFAPTLGIGILQLLAGKIGEWNQHFKAENYIFMGSSSNCLPWQNIHQLLELVEFKGERKTNTKTKIKENSGQTTPTLHFLQDDMVAKLKVISKRPKCFF